MKKSNWLKRLSSSLTKTSQTLSHNLHTFFTQKKVTADDIERLEEIFLESDMGIRVSTDLARSIKTYTGDFSQILEQLSNTIQTILDPVAVPLSIQREDPPHIILMCGINGSGKTTTCAKLGFYLKEKGHSIHFAACDTFRAAATEQLAIWAKKLSIPFSRGQQGEDPSSVAFAALDDAIKTKKDVLLIDTAGRLHNNTNLMAELGKIKRVLKKKHPKGKITSILSLDANIGQNTQNQLDMFQRDVGIDGIIMNKLDGSPRGGILVALSQAYSLPIIGLGIGEKADDFIEFDAKDFTSSLLSLEDREIL